MHHCRHREVLDDQDPEHRPPAGRGGLPTARPKFHHDCGRRQRQEAAGKHPCAPIDSEEPEHSGNHQQAGADLKRTAQEDQPLNPCQLQAEFDADRKRQQDDADLGRPSMIAGSLTSPSTCGPIRVPVNRKLTIGVMPSREQT